jgi:hypothetical protein
MQQREEAVETSGSDIAAPRYSHTTISNEVESSPEYRSEFRQTSITRQFGSDGDDLLHCSGQAILS